MARPAAKLTQGFAREVAVQLQDPGRHLLGQFHDRVGISEMGNQNWDNKRPRGLINFPGRIGADEIGRFIHLPDEQSDGVGSAATAISASSRDRIPQIFTRTMLFHPYPTGIAFPAQRLLANCPAFSSHSRVDAGGLMEILAA